MMKIGAIALFGLLALSPVARAADTPAFVSAALCDAAAPINATIAVTGRQIRAETPVRKRAAAQAHPQSRRAAAQARRAPRTPQIAEGTETPALDAEAVLRPAVHFCVTPAGTGNPVRYT
ncbi:hypothetical protein [Muricoccus vinaceus]|uniref:Uncharacterized protein n=1 Tax=Muricoccus vinaceus TaxID=424704 RepID=A0ABV6IXU5_9PROT